MSVAGVARDLAARMKVPFTQLSPIVAEQGSIPEGVAVEIVDADLCGRFLVRVLGGITVGESPTWMANRLTHLGMRPINSVVDVSNYVMLELGQPNHTYDLEKVAGPTLRVRWAREGETIRTLDDADRALTSGDGVIADGDDNAIGIAGVMGGASTEISDTTTSVLLEMAWWDPMSIARSSARLGLRSEASMRFERGADPEVVELAARRFAELLAPAGATLAAGAVDRRGNLPSRDPVPVRIARVNGLLGTDLGGEDVDQLLSPIGFDVEPVGAGEPGVQRVTIPSFRYDTATETDIIEEIARHHSYSRIPRTVPPAVRTGGLTVRQADRRAIRQTMVGLGLDEAMPLPFVSVADVEASGLPGEFVTVTNPLDAGESVLRTSLRTGLLKSVAYNASHRHPGMRLFEIGKVFGRPVDGAQLPDEREHLGAALAGDDAIGAAEIWQVLAESLAFEGHRIEQVAVAGLHPTRSAEIVATAPDGTDLVIGAVGEIHPSVLDRFAIAERVGWLEVDLDRLLDLPHGSHSYRPISRHPSSDFDLAFEVPETTSAAAVERTIVESAGELLADIRLFDVYRGAGLPDGHRSLAYRLRLQAHDRTLTDADAAAVRAAVVAAAAERHGAVLRG
jgi:phenylalanyl-tRNA synthetase beta chain